MNQTKKEIVRVAEDTAADSKPRKRWRVTMWAEGYDEDIDAALESAMGFAKFRYIYITFGSKEPDGPKMGIRTSRARKARER